MKVLYCWLGNSDQRLIGEENPQTRGPIYQALMTEAWDRIVLLSNTPAMTSDAYVSQLRLRLGDECPQLKVVFVGLDDPTDFRRIFTEVSRFLEDEYRADDENCFHLSPGTPAMASIWLVLSQWRYPARLIQSSREQGVRTVELPFSLEARESADVGRALESWLIGDVEHHPAFHTIIHSHPLMTDLIARAQKAARFDIPVLILGESGTGKELVSRAIHGASARSNGPFVAINCGAIPSELMESILFGHVKGAFTGAQRDSKGVFEQADGGSLFLDEIGELPLDMQVKLLRVLQERRVTKVGGSVSQAVDVRIISATNRMLYRDASQGRFRSDLYYRLAVAVLNLPPLSQRGDDALLIAESILRDTNIEFAAGEGWVPRTFDAGARDFIRSFSWPGNIRQLQNCIRQAVLWSDTGVISIGDMTSAANPGALPGTGKDRVPHPGSLQEELDEISRERILQALELSGGNKTSAAAMLGFRNHQTLVNWMKRIGLEYNDVS